MILQTIHCSVKGCKNTYTEKEYNEGFFGWGHIAGLRDDRTGETIGHLCPEHLQIVERILNNGMD